MRAAWSMAVGLHPFKRLPQEAEHLPAGLCSHSGEYGSLERLDGKEVIVVGSGIIRDRPGGAAP